MTTGDIGEVTVNVTIVEVVTSFALVGALTTSDGLVTKIYEEGLQREG